MHGAMPRPARLQTNDEEQGKIDDIRKPKSSNPPTPRWNSAVPRFRKRRWAALILAMGFLYVFFKNIPEGLTPVSQRADRRVPGRSVNNMPIPIKKPARENKRPQQTPVPASTPASAPAKKSSKAPRPDDEGSGPLHYYNGDIDFPVLLDTLQAESSMFRYGTSSNIMFVAGNLQSASILIPMVCEMTRATKNVVNFAYFGRDDLPLRKIQEVNGVKDGCNATWHDARPDQHVYSSDERFVKAVTDAMEQINAYVRPEAFFRVDAGHEEKPFVDALKLSLGINPKPIIEIPTKGTNTLMWLTRLDAKSLSSWQQLDIKILIQVTKENVGGLFQLLKSIMTADYTGHRYPHVIFEVPADLDIPSLNVVDNFSWPPTRNGEIRRSEVSIRKKISRKHTSPLESAIRTVEHFYPAQPIFEHVMVLSADVELSPMWYHYLVYNVLEYAYSYRSLGQTEPGLLAGISLITPLMQLDQQTPFKPPRWTPPALWDPDLGPPKMESPDSVPFMWQAPDTIATLYFGYKWKEFHSFLSLRLEAADVLIPRKIPQNIAPFAEPLNELMELRGWSILYPNLPAHHIARYRPNLATREEFTPIALKAGDSTAIPAVDKDADPYSTGVYSPTVGRFSGPADPKTLASGPIHNLIPNNGLLSALRLLPVLDRSGNPTTAPDLLQDSHVKRDSFRQTFGHCLSTALPLPSPLTAEDMFCNVLGEPYSGSGIVAETAPPIDWEKARLQQEEFKNNALGDATPIDTGDKAKELEVHEEFLKHLQRQSAGVESAAADIQDERKAMPDSTSGLESAAADSQGEAKKLLDSPSGLTAGSNESENPRGP